MQIPGSARGMPCTSHDLICRYARAPKTVNVGQKWADDVIILPCKAHCFASFTQTIHCMQSCLFISNLFLQCYNVGYNGYTEKKYTIEK